MYLKTLKNRIIILFVWYLLSMKNTTFFSNYRQLQQNYEKIRIKFKQKERELINYYLKYFNELDTVTFFV